MSAGWAIAAKANKVAPRQAQSRARSSSSAPAKKKVATMSKPRAKSSGGGKTCGPALLCAEDKSWRAESDLRTLAEAERIKGDKARLTMAQSKAIEQAEAAKANLKLVAGSPGAD